MTNMLEMQLESLVDQHGLSAVLNELANICTAKADHIRSSYSDESLARCWERDSKFVAKAESLVTKY